MGTVAVALTRVGTISEWLEWGQRESADKSDALQIWNLAEQFR